MCDKACYTESEARHILNSSRKKWYTKAGDLHKPNKKVPYRCYYCEECCAWHTTKVRKNEYYITT